MTEKQTNLFNRLKIIHIFLTSRPCQKTINWTWKLLKNDCIWRSPEIFRFSSVDHIIITQLNKQNLPKNPHRKWVHCFQSNLFLLPMNLEILIFDGKIYKRRQWENAILLRPNLFLLVIIKLELHLSRALREFSFFGFWIVLYRFLYHKKKNFKIRDYLNRETLNIR